MSSARPGGARTVRGRAACRAVRARRALVSGGVRSRFQEFTHVLSLRRAAVARPARARMRGRVRVACRPCGLDRRCTQRYHARWRGACRRCRRSRFGRRNRAAGAGGRRNAERRQRDRAAATGRSGYPGRRHVDHARADRVAHQRHHRGRAEVRAEPDGPQALYRRPQQRVRRSRLQRTAERARASSTPTACCCRTCSAQATRIRRAGR